MVDLESKIQLLHKVKQYPDSELGFLLDSCKAAIRCRAMLKWSYAYGFYTIPNKTKIKLSQFEFWQTDLEHFCEKMHMLVEKPLDEFLDPEVIDRSPFYKFRSELISITDATRRYYISLIEGLEEEADQMNIS